MDAHRNAAVEYKPGQALLAGRKPGFLLWAILIGVIATAGIGRLVYGVVTGDMSRRGETPPTTR